MRIGSGPNEHQVTEAELYLDAMGNDGESKLEKVRNKHFRKLAKLPEVHDDGFEPPKPKKLALT
jgi:hypothetical protein